VKVAATGRVDFLDAQYDHDDAINCQIMQQGAPFIGHSVSLTSLSELITRLAQSPMPQVRASRDVSRA
jgi:hypothetical protein